LNLDPFWEDTSGTGISQAELSPREGLKSN
jgi:hypothetical protein